MKHNDAEHGDFTGLAQDYSLYRPDYSSSVLSALLGLVSKEPRDLDFVDVGAGTGIWTRMVAQTGLRSVVAIEPNEDMRRHGEVHAEGRQILWRAGTAENTGMAESSCDWLTMASSFHWADFDSATKEFHRVLRPGGLFTALWNPRLIELNPLLVEIEQEARKANPKLERVSSGRSGITEKLTQRLSDSPFFEDVVYVQAQHIISMTPSRYLGAWRSVNDVRVQLGVDGFRQFLDFVERRTKGLESIEATYMTRAWSARSKG